MLTKMRKFTILVFGVADVTDSLQFGYKVFDMTCTDFRTAEISVAVSIFSNSNSKIVEDLVPGMWISL